MKNLTKSSITLPLSLIIIDSLLFSLSDPRKVPSFLLIVAFLLLTATFYYVVKGLVKLLGWYGVNAKHPNRLASTITAVFGGITALQSIGELTGRDMLVLLPLVLVGYLYFSYNPRSSKGKTSQA